MKKLVIGTIMTLLTTTAAWGDESISLEDYWENYNKIPETIVCGELQELGDLKLTFDKGRVNFVSIDELTVSCPRGDGINPCEKSIHTNGGFSQFSDAHYSEVTTPQGHTIVEIEGTNSFYTRAGQNGVDYGLQLIAFKHDPDVFYLLDYYSQGWDWYLPHDRSFNIDYKQIYKVPSKIKGAKCSMIFVDDNEEE